MVVKLNISLNQALELYVLVTNSIARDRPEVDVAGIERSQYLPICEFLAWAIVKRKIIAVAISIGYKNGFQI